MELKPGYKQTNIGVIPDCWSVKTLIEIADHQKVLFDDGDWIEAEHITDAGRTRLIQTGNIGVGCYVEKESKKYIYEESFEKLRCKELTVGDILICRLAEPAGRACVFPDIGEERVITSVDVTIFRPKVEKVDREFLVQYFSTRNWFVSVLSNVGGTTHKRISRGALGTISVPFPPVKEQCAIATALSDVDALLDGLDWLIVKKRDLKQAAMQQLLTGKTRLPGFEGEWEAKRLGEAGKCLRGVSYKGDSDLSIHDTPHTKRLLRSNNVQNSVVVTEEVQFVNAARVSSHQVLQQDDILICMANGSKALVGKAGIFKVSDGYDYTFGAFMGCFRTNSAEANPAFVFYLFLTGRYRDYISNLLAGSSINNLRPSSIESLEFSMPLLPEQAAIATVLSDMDAEIAALEQRRNKTKDIKQAMMQELLTGRIRLV